MKLAFLYSSNSKLIEIILDACSKNEISLLKESDFANFIYTLQDAVIDLIIYDFVTSFENGLKHIKIIRKLKPKTPLIVIADELDKDKGGKIYETNIFHLAIKPLSSDLINQIITAAINDNKNKRDNY